ncbi:MAG TPA: DUF2807 domain-containing protein [Chitinophagales bacterium]|nr:DUF2807 domain-containing protein [Chitinophagales bacterium]
MVNFKKLRQMISTAGSGNVVQKEFQVSSFIRLHLGINGNAELIQSAEEKVVLECDDNLLDTVEVTNSGDTLYVVSGSKLSVAAYTSCTVKVYYRQLDTLVNSSNGNLTNVGTTKLSGMLTLKLQANGNTHLQLDVPAIKLTNQSNGNTTLTGRCGELEVRNQANGSLNAKALLAGKVNLNNMANGNVEVCSLDTITIYHMGNGWVHYYGTGVLKDVKQYGTGAVKHKAD